MSREGFPQQRAGQTLRTLEFFSAGFAVSAFN
jgi:hypothetical protein